MVTENLSFQASFTPIEDQNPKENRASQGNFPSMRRKEAIPLNLFRFVFISTIVSSKSMDQPIQLQTNGKTCNSGNFRK